MQSTTLQHFDIVGFGIRNSIQPLKIEL